MPQTPVENSVVPIRKRSTFELSADNYQIISEAAHRLGLTDNAALNVVLAELRDWRSGLRVAPGREKR